MADIFGEIHEVRKGLWAFFLDCAFLDADWLGRETPIAGILEQSWERVKTANEMTQGIRTSSRRLNFLFPFLL